MTNGRFLKFAILGTLGWFATDMAQASVFYKFEMAAETGYGFDSFRPGVSLNDKGQLAFVGATTGTGGILYVTDPSAQLGPVPALQPRAIWPGTASAVNAVDMSFPQVNNSGKAVFEVVGPYSLYGVMVADSNLPTDQNQIDLGGRILFSNKTMQTLGSMPAINNNPNGIEIGSDNIHQSISVAPGNGDGVCDPGESCVNQVVFSASVYATPATEYLTVPTVLPCADHGPQGTLCNGAYATAGAPSLANSEMHPRIADTGQVVVRAPGVASPIRLYDPTLSSSQDIAGALNGFTVLGPSPGISADGKIVVFYGNRGQGMGVFASVDDGSPQRKLIRLAGENAIAPRPELGLDITVDPNSGVGTANDLYFAAFHQSYRVNVTHFARGNPGMVGDSFVVGFTATPNHASRSNPMTGKPLTFSANEGIWTVRVDIEEPLKDRCITPGADGVLNSVSTLPNRVVQGTDPAQLPMNVIVGAGGPCVSAPVGDDQSNYHVRMPLPVVQIGDTIPSNDGTRYTIDGLLTHDVIAAATMDDSGLNVRTMRPGDHRVAFYAASGSKQFIVRGSHLDSDQDGLLDHWEEDGIDVDQDGIVDLDLKAMGADPCVRDLFVEIDWLNDRPPGPLNRWHKNRPIAGVTQALVDMFKQAPAPDGENPLNVCATPPGIVAHIDAGPGLDSAMNPYSHNMGAGPMEGSDLIHVSNSNYHIDVVYFGLPLGTTPIPGLQLRSFDEIKSLYFGTQDKRAREFAFRYVILADFQNAYPLGAAVASSTAGVVTLQASVPQPDQGAIHDKYPVVAIGSDINNQPSSRSGQIRVFNSFDTTGTQFSVSPNWAIPPVNGDHLVFLPDSTGLAERGNRQDYSTIPGNDVVISLGAFGSKSPAEVAPSGELGDYASQWRTIAHELGHSLGLRHGGDDETTSKVPGDTSAKPNYLSLMNYLYQICDPIKVPACSSVNGFSGGLPLVSGGNFNDWQHLRFDFFSTPFALGETVLGALGAPSVGLPSMNSTATAELTVRDLAPYWVPATSHIQIAMPADSAIVVMGTVLTVRTSVTSGVVPDTVTVFMDVNGDDNIDPMTEALVAMPVATGGYQVTFGPVTGASGWRFVRAQLKDAAGHYEEVVQSIQVVSRLVGDVDGDGDVDQDDINLVLAARGQQANGANDPRDVDGDGKITVLDARKITTLCTRPRCAVK